MFSRLSRSAFQCFLLLSAPSFWAVQGDDSHDSYDDRHDSYDDIDHSRDICDVTYSVQLSAVYPDNVVIPCTDEQYDEITAIIHSVVKLDSIMSLLGTSVPHFVLAEEMEGESAYNDLDYIEKALLAFDGPSQKELAAPHLTEEDELEDTLYDEKDADQESRRSLLTAAAPVAAVTADSSSPAVAHRDLQKFECSMSSCRADWCCIFCTEFCRRRRLSDITTKQRELGSPDEDAAKDAKDHYDDIHKLWTEALKVEERARKQFQEKQVEMYQLYANSKDYEVNEKDLENEVAKAEELVASAIFEHIQSESARADAAGNYVAKIAVYDDEESKQIQAELNKKYREENENFAKELAKLAGDKEKKTEGCVKDAQKKADDAQKDYEDSHSKKDLKKMNDLQERALEFVKALKEARSDGLEALKKVSTAANALKIAKEIIKGHYYRHDADSPLYQAKAGHFNERVTRTIKLKLSKWARETNCLCLGNSWELDVTFKKVDHQVPE